MSSDRRVIYSAATSLDGFVARDDGAVDWLFEADDMGFDAFLERVDTVLMGRRTYDKVLELVGPDAWPYANKKSYVFSRTRAGTATDHVRFLDDDPADVVDALRESSGGHVWLVGGGELAHAFARARLIDEIHLAIHPIVLGSGIPLFAGAIPDGAFALRSVRPHRTGVILCEYERPTRATVAPKADPSVLALWQAYLRSRAQDPKTSDWTFTARGFGDTPALQDEHINLVLTGRMAATARTMLELEAGDEAIPEVGDHVVGLDSRGVARCVLRTTKVAIRRFEDVPRSFTVREGADSLDEWKHTHWAAAERVLAPFGLAPSPSMDIVCEELDMVFGPADLLSGLADDD